MKIINKEQAREIVLRMLHEEFLNSDNPPLIIDANTIETSFGWVFFYNSKEYLKKGNIMTMYLGNAPILVDKESGIAQYTGTARDISFYIKEYESKRKI